MPIEERLYLACYIVETETEETIRIPNSAPRVKKSPYFDESGNSLSGEKLKGAVLIRETPRFIIAFEAKPPSGASYKVTLDGILRSHKFDTEKDRWCWLRGNRFGIVLFYLLRESDFPTINRSRIISQAYGSADFYPRYFLEKLNQSSLCTQYIPPSDPNTGEGSANRPRRRPWGALPPIDWTEMGRAPNETEIKEFLRRLKELLQEPDGGDSGRRFFRHSKTSVLVACRFLDKIRREAPHANEVSKKTSIIDPDDKRTARMKKVQKDAEKSHLPADKRSNDEWITASDLARSIVKSKNSSIKNVNKKEQVFKEDVQTAIRVRAQITYLNERFLTE